MHAELRGAEQKLGIELTNIARAAEATSRFRDEARKAVSDVLYRELPDEASGNTGLDIIAFGSMAREEMGPGSDFDYLVVAYKLKSNPRTIHVHREAAIHAIQQTTAKPPGPSGLFGVMISGIELVNVIGLNADTNNSLSRRILILQESVPLWEHSQHDLLVTSITNRYLFDYRTMQESIVPRFLLNDVLRYWRTLAVDYQAKRWDEMKGVKWGLRYIKLRSSRKWTYAGMLTSVLMPVISGKVTEARTLSEQFKMPALARIAQLSNYVPEHSQAADALARVLISADKFIGWLADQKFRSDVEAVDDPRDQRAPANFKLARNETGVLQQALEDLFFSNDPLGDGPHSLGSLSRKYLSF